MEEKNPNLKEMTKNENNLVEKSLQLNKLFGFFIF